MMTLEKIDSITYVAYQKTGRDRNGNTLHSINFFHKVGGSQKTKNINDLIPVRKNKYNCIVTNEEPKNYIEFLYDNHIKKRYVKL